MTLPNREISKLFTIVRAKYCTCLGEYRISAKDVSRLELIIMQALDWRSGVDMKTFLKFSQELRTHYVRAMMGSSAQHTGQPQQHGRRPSLTESKSLPPIESVV